MPLYVSRNHTDGDVVLYDRAAAVVNHHVQMSQISTITHGISSLNPVSLNPTYLSRNPSLLDEPVPPVFIPPLIPRLPRECRASVSSANPGLAPSFRRSLPETGCLSQGLPNGHLAKQCRPLFSPPRHEVPPHNATGTEFPAQFAGLSHGLPYGTSSSPVCPPQTATHPAPPPLACVRMPTEYCVAPPPRRLTLSWSERTCR